MTNIAVHQVLAHVYMHAGQSRSEAPRGHWRAFKRRECFQFASEDAQTDDLGEEFGQKNK